MSARPDRLLGGLASARSAKDAPAFNQHLRALAERADKDLRKAYLASLTSGERSRFLKALAAFKPGFASEQVNGRWVSDRTRERFIGRYLSELRKDALDTLREDVTRLHAAFPDQRGGIADWATDWAYVGQQGSSDIGEQVEAVIAYFDHLWQTDEALKSAIASEGHRLGAENKRTALRRGSLNSARTTMSTLCDDGLVSAEELSTFDSLVTGVLSRLPTRQDDASEGGGRKPPDRKLGIRLMSLMRAAGYGEVVGNNFSIKVAAGHVSAIAALYGYALPATSLGTWASPTHQEDRS